ncbi:MAG: hypothetical protein WCO14_04780, partial [bacterium]
RETATRQIDAATEEKPDAPLGPECGSALAQNLRPNHLGHNINFLVTEHSYYNIPAAPPL